MAYYESVFIARQDVSSAQVDTLVDTFTNILQEQGGKVTKKEYWGLRNLTYRIKKNRKGHYVMLNLDAPPAAVNEMERNMRISEDIIRFMTVRVDALEEGPSAMMQSKNREGRDEREGGGRFRDRDEGRRFGPRRSRGEASENVESAVEGGAE